MPSLGNFPAEYKLFKMTDSEIKYETKKIEHIDADKLAEVCKGYSKKDIALMKNDFQQYTWNRSHAVYSKKIRKDISPETVGIKESSALYGKLKLVTDGLRELSDTPIYGENGIQAMAVAYGLEIPNSSYSTLNEALTTAYLTYKSGRRIYSQDSDDFKLIVKLIAFSIRKSAAEAADGDVLFDANAFLRELGYSGTVADNILKDFSKKYGFATPEEKAALSLAFALFGGFCSDTDGVENRDGTIPGYGVKETAQNRFAAAFEKILIKIIEIIKKFYPIFNQFFEKVI